MYISVTREHFLVFKLTFVLNVNMDFVAGTAAFKMHGPNHDMVKILRGMSEEDKSKLLSQVQSQVVSYESEDLKTYVKNSNNRSKLLSTVKNFINSEFENESEENIDATNVIGVNLTFDEDQKLLPETKA